MWGKTGPSSPSYTPCTPCKEATIPQDSLHVISYSSYGEVGGGIGIQDEANLDALLHVGTESDTPAVH